MRFAGMLAVALAAVALAAVVLRPAVAEPAGGSPGAEGPTVYAWFPRDFNNWDTRAIDWSALTHICYRSVVLQPDGTLKEPVSRSDVKALVDEAHAHGVKVTVLVWGTDSAGSSRYLAHHAEEAVQSLLDYVKANDLDGVNMDDETWRATNGETGGPNREPVTRFFRLLHKAFKEARPDYHLSWASPPVVSADDPYGASWIDYEAVADLVDALAIMSYTMNPPTIGWTTGAQPVEGGGKVKGHPRDYVTCIRDYVQATGGRAEKLLLGLSNYRGGTEWTCRSGEPLSPIIGKPRKLTPEQARANADRHGRRFDPRQKVPWYCYQEDERWVQGWYEDEESLAAKLELVEAHGLQGICIWVLDGAAEPPSTFELLRKHLAPGAVPTPSRDDAHAADSAADRNRP